MMEQYCVGDLAEADRKSSSPCKKHCCGIAIAALLAGVAVAFVIKRALKN
uniref:Uncharacterized protein n=1 Tax=Megaselia scalaris TaxID=36166 RepID=T1H542_MEGSC